MLAVAVAQMCPFLLATFFPEEEITVFQDGGSRGSFPFPGEVQQASGSQPSLPT